jgi:pectate disaccharide-lyase
MKKAIVVFCLCILMPIAISAQTLGDVNHSGSIDIVDSLLVAQYYVGLNPANFYSSEADSNCSGSIDIVDALLIAQYYVGLIASLPCTSTPAPTPVTTAAPTTAVTPDPNPGNAIYVSPSGSASAAGTESAPTTLDSAISRIQAGQTIYMRGGTYNLSTTITIPATNNGTSASKKSIVAYGSEIPILNFSAMTESSSNRGIQLYGNYWYIKGIIIEQAGDNGMYIGGNNNTIERCVTRKNHDTGLQLGRSDSSYTSIGQWPSNNLILQCESYDNADSTAENADGFACKLTTGNGNVFRGCISHNNLDDGWDLYTKTDTGPIGPVTIEYCIAYNNGTLTDGSVTGSGDKNGFKLGGEDISVNHTVRYCISFRNGKHGFTYNRNLGTIDFYNNTSCYSTQRNFNFDGGTSTFRNNLSLESGDTDRILGSTLNPDYNCWWGSSGTINTKGLVVTTADFASLTIGSIGFNADGTLDYGNFCKLASGSDLIGSGMSGSNIGAR